MYIYKIKIENFRNFECFEWKPNKHSNIIFGSNGSGKTNLAIALDMLFSTNRNESYFDNADFYCGDIDKKIHIEAWLADIDNAQFEISEIIQYIDENDELVYEDSVKPVKKVIIVQLENGVDGKKEWSIVQNDDFKDFSLRKRDAVGYTFISADRQPLKEINLNTRSKVYSLSEGKIDEALDNMSKDIINYADGKFMEQPKILEFLSKLNNIIELKLWDNLEIALKNPQSIWNYSGYEIRSNKNGASLTFDRQSKGFQNIFLLSLIKATLNENAIVFIEELEQNLEPKNQRQIANSFCKTSSGQRFITSHSADLISCFDFDDILLLNKDCIRLIAERSDEKFRRQVSQSNKKDYIASLMASNILIVEGESELSSFHIYSAELDEILYKKDLEIIMAKGKSNISLYAQKYKSLGKKVIALIDNDNDVETTLEAISANCDEIYIACDSYEDMIYPYLGNKNEELCEILPFNMIKDKLMSYKNRCDEDIKTKDKLVKDEVLKLDFEMITNYDSLYPNKFLFNFSIHDRFATPYYARSIANIIVCDGVPEQVKILFESILQENKNLAKFANIDNVYYLKNE